jgi:Rod binding domain-containing protein
MTAPLSGVGGLRGPGRIADTPAEQLQRSANLLESEFLNTLFRVMRETVPENEDETGQATEIFWSMLDREVADRTALAGGYGLGAAIYRQLEPKLGDER